MKKILQLLFLYTLTTPLHSQNCEDYIIDEKDNTTGERIYSGKDFITLTNKEDTVFQILTLLSNDQKTLILSLTAPKITCIDPYDEAYFTFEDNTKFHAAGNQDFNCNGAFSIYFGDYKKNDELMKLLITKKVISLRLYCRGGTAEVPLSTADSNELMGELNCLNKHLKP